MTALPRSLLTARLPGIDRPLTSPERAQLDNYLNLLTKWQKTHRLIGSVEPAWVVENVFLDSLCFLAALPTDVRRLADLGSGAGVPGIPIAIVRADLPLTLIEARQRRVSFLSTVVRELALGHVEVVASRAEDLGDEFQSRFDAVVMRCAGSQPTLRAVALRLVRPGGSLVVAGGPSVALEVPGGEEIVVRTPTGTLRTFHRYARLEPGELEH